MGERVVLSVGRVATRRLLRPWRSTLLETIPVLGGDAHFGMQLQLWDTQGVP